MDDSSGQCGASRDVRGGDHFWLTVWGEFDGATGVLCTVCRVSPVDEEGRCLLDECLREVARDTPVR